ncbi:hypothetical protein MOSE0_B05908 [Monosporozyma servazzii]
MSLPTSMKATVIDNGKAVIKSVPLPQLDDEYILIKTKAVAGNPADWKHVKFGLGPNGAVVGVDAAGEIVKLGSKVDTNKFHLGDYVYGFIHGSSHRRPDNGAFAEYVALDPKIAFHVKNGLSGESYIQEGPVDSLEAGASITSSWLTAGATLFYHMGLKMEWEPKQVQIDGTILIWGGATALSLAILQLLPKINAVDKVVVVASKKHEAKLMKLGVTEVFDYHDADVIDQIKTKYTDLVWLLDCVSTPETFNQVYQCAPTHLKSTVINYMGFTRDTIKPELRQQKDVTFDDTNLYTCFGFDVTLGEKWFVKADPKYRKVIIKFVEFVSDKLVDGSLNHIPIKVYKNGLESTIQIMEDLENGKNSGEKLVATFN